MAKRCRTCCPACGTVCLTTRDFCNTNTRVAGILATLTQGGTTVGTCTTTFTVVSVTITAQGSGYTSAPTVGFSGPGTGAAATANMVAAVGSLNLTNGGTGYTSAPTVSISGPGGGGTTATATATVAGGVVTGLTLTGGGSGYSSPPSVNISGGGGTGATATATLSTSLRVGTVTVTAGGSGYTSVPTVSFTGAGGTGAAGTAATDTKCCIPIPAAGTYTLAATGTGFTASSSTINPTCTTNSFQFSMAHSTRPVAITALGLCGLVEPTVTVTVKQAGVTVASGAVDGSGIFTPTLSAGVLYTATAADSAGRLSYTTTSFTVSACPGAVTQTAAVTASAAAGYAPCGNCALPTAQTVTLTDSQVGVNVTLTWGTGFTLATLNTQTGWMGSVRVPPYQVDSVTINSSSGYAPNVNNVAIVFSGGGGSGASAMGSTDAGGHLTSIQVFDGGDGYTSAPSATTASTGATCSLTVNILPPLYSYLLQDLACGGPRLVMAAAYRMPSGQTMSLTAATCPPSPAYSFDSGAGATVIYPAHSTFSAVE